MMGIAKALLQLSKKLGYELKEQGVQFKDIISFAESESGLNLKLYAGQKFIFKLFYGLPLSNNKKENEIVIKDNFNEKVLYRFSEVEFLEFLYKEKRINVSPDYILKNVVGNDHHFDEVLFVIGRRGSKSFMVTLIIVYTTYLLLSMYDPHKFFNLPYDEFIGIAITANGADNALELHRKIVSLIKRTPFFKPFIVRDVSQNFELITSAGLDQVNDISKQSTHRINIASFGVSPSVRGKPNIVVVLDEIAHYIDSNNQKKLKPLDVEMYSALTPSTSTFIGRDGRSYGKIFLMTSPNGPKGLAYRKYVASKNDPNILAVNVPSWWINPNISPNLIKRLYEQSELAYRQEYLGEFVSSNNAWIKNPDKLFAQVNILLKNSLKNGQYGKQYFLGLDFASSNDRVAFAVAHYEPIRGEHIPLDKKYSIFLNNKDIVVVDYIGLLIPDEDSLGIDEIMNEIVALHRHFKISEGIFDQWAGGLFEAEMKKRRLTHLKKVPATTDMNDEWAKTFKMYLNEGRLMLPYYEDFLEEVLGLTEVVGRNGRIKVENPNHHDDMFDAVSRAIWLVHKNKDKIKERKRLLHRVTRPKKRYSSKVGVVY